MRAVVTAVGLLVVVAAVVGAGTTVVDPDGDDRAVLAELLDGTDPTVADTDGDGLDDGAEHARGTDPLAPDTDGDGLSDARELEVDTSPVDPDTDGDGLGDGAELEAGLDPRLADTDGDGLSDARELELPTYALRADTDRDGLSDARELELGTNATDADTDGDGLADGEEGPGVDPTVADTDGDGLGDGLEEAIGTDPTVADTDGDGLTDGREREVRTNPLVADTDRDGLSDGRELSGPTNATDVDTDDDGLRDGWEVAGETPDGVALPGADPMAKDLFVRVDYAPGIDRLSAAERSALAERFGSMPVANPDGSEGVDLHLVEGDRLDERVTVGSDDEFERLRERYYDEADLGASRCVYHRTLLVYTEGGEYLGVGAAPGYFSVAGGRDRSRVEGALTARSATLVHELLHNVVGELSDPATLDGYHTDGGWLAHQAGGGRYLSEPVADQLSTAGFATAPLATGC